MSKILVMCSLLTKRFSLCIETSKLRAKFTAVYLLYSVCYELLSVLLAEEYAYLLNKSESFIAHRLITALLSVVFSCILQFTLRLAVINLYYLFSSEFEK